MNGNSFYGPLEDPAGDAGYAEHPPRVGFFTDTSVCIGCKACEVACKEWNMVPDDGFDLLGCHSTTRVSWARTRGGMWRSSSSRSANQSIWGCRGFRAQAMRRARRPVRTSGG